MMLRGGALEGHRYYLAIRRTDTKSLIGTIDSRPARTKARDAAGARGRSGERGKGYGRAALERRKDSWRTSWEP